MGWLDALGWAGSALLVYSILQSRVLKLRLLNLCASATLAVFNGLVGVWPMVAMNVALVCINGYFLIAMTRAKSAGQAFEWMKSSADDPYVQRLVQRWGADIETFHPDFAAQLSWPGTQIALLFHGETSVGLVAFRLGEAGEAELLVDYVIGSYRDFAPGGFVFSAGGPLAAAGVSRATVGGAKPAVATYLRKVGFQEDNGRLTRPIP